VADLFFREALEEPDDAGPSGADVTVRPGSDVLQIHLTDLIQDGRRAHAESDQIGNNPMQLCLFETFVTGLWIHCGKLSFG
jgi:hypothetical protein